MDIRQKAVQEIAEWIRIDRTAVVPFLGAGVSRALGLPNWHELAHHVLEAAENFRVIKPERALTLAHESPLEILTACKQALGDTAFERQVTNKLSKRDTRPSLVSQMSWYLNDQLIITTNLDKIIEESLPATLSGNVSSVTTHDSVASYLKKGGRSVLHLHGVLDRYDTWVMTNDAYEKALNPVGPNGAILQTLLSSKVLLFLGFSCNDVDFNYFVDNIARNFPKGWLDLYAFLPRPKQEETKRLLEMGITPIPYAPTVNPEPEIIDFIQSILTNIDPTALESQLTSLQAASTPKAFTSPAELREMTSSRRRETLNEEFKNLFANHANAAISNSTSLPPAIEQRRSDVLDSLSASWLVGTTAPHNGIYGREVMSSVGRGGFGEVYLVEDFQDRSRQALKVAHFQETTNLKFVERFRQGIRAMRRLTRYGVKNITRVIDDYEVPLCVFMDYYEGGDLGDLIKATNYPYHERLRLGLEISQIIADAHSHKVYHRDLKPSNVLIDFRDDGIARAILTDFDLAWFEGALSRTTTRMGDHTFASPEQLREAKAHVEVRASSDVYSLGMMLFYLIKKGYPSPGQWMNANLEQEVFSAVEKQCLWKSGGVKIAELIKRCAAEHPSDRPEAEAVVAELQKLYAAESDNESQALFVAEINHRLLKGSAYDRLRKSIHVEVKKSYNVDIVQATFTRIRNEADVRGDFNQHASKHVNALQQKLVGRGWKIVSTTSNTREGRLIASLPVENWDVDSVEMIVSALSFSLSGWMNWT